jgi:hypothetical protein
MADRYYSVPQGAQLPTQVTKGSSTSGEPIELRVNDSLFGAKLQVIEGVNAIHMRLVSDAVMETIEPEPFEPEQLAVLAGYWDSRDLSDGAVASWVSRDSLAQTVTQGTGSAQPTKGATGVVFDGGDSLSRTALPSVFVSQVTLPDGTASAAGKGPTCTGLTQDNDGNWWVSHHGKKTEFDADPWAPALLKYSPDFATLLDEIELAPLYTGIESVQGVVFDKSDGTLWFADLAGQAIRHITTAGVAITADEIALTYTPNGLARDHAADALWITTEASDPLPNVVEKRSCVDGSLIASLTVSTSAKDQLFYHDDTTTLLMTSGSNGSPGIVSVLSAPGNVLIPAATLTLPAETDAVEGIWWDGANRLVVVNDGYYHGQTPALNQAIQVDVPILAASTIDLFGVVIVPVTTGTDALFTMGDPLAAATVGTGLYTASATDLRTFQHTGGTGTTTQESCIAVSPSLVSARIFYARIAAAGLTIWVDGTQVATDSGAALVGAMYNLAILRICAAADSGGRLPTATVKAMGYTMGQGDRQKLEGFLAHEFALTANLPGDHPHKTDAPEA